MNSDSQQPDYNYILALLDKAKHALRADFGRPMDWEVYADGGLTMTVTLVDEKQGEGDGSAAGAELGAG